MDPDVDVKLANKIFKILFSYIFIIANAGKPSMNFKQLFEEL